MCSTKLLFFMHVNNVLECICVWLFYSECEISCSQNRLNVNIRHLKSTKKSSRECTKDIEKATFLACLYKYTEISSIKGAKKSWLKTICLIIARKSLLFEKILSFAIYFHEKIIFSALCFFFFLFYHQNVYRFYIFLAAHKFVIFLSFLWWRHWYIHFHMSPLTMLAYISSFHI